MIQNGDMISGAKGPKLSYACTNEILPPQHHDKETKIFGIDKYRKGSGKWPEARVKNMEYRFTKENFEEEVIKSDVPVLVDFYADWCGPCKMMFPVVEKLAEEFEGKAKVGKVNVDEQEELAARFGVMSIPFFAVIKDGKMVDSNLGATSAEALAEKLKAVL